MHHPVREEVGQILKHSVCQLIGLLIGRVQRRRLHLAINLVARNWVPRHCVSIIFVEAPDDFPEVGVDADGVSVPWVVELRYHPDG